jgi:hypothetical protein
MCHDLKSQPTVQLKYGTFIITIVLAASIVEKKKIKVSVI